MVLFVEMICGNQNFWFLHIYISCDTIFFQLYAEIFIPISVCQFIGRYNNFGFPNTDTPVRM